MAKKSKSEEGCFGGPVKGGHVVIPSSPPIDFKIVSDSGVISKKKKGQKGF